MLLRLLPLVALMLLPLAAQADTHRTLTAPDGSTVDLVRDEYGVPRIYATTETGAFYAQGWAVAQDRLFQMETFWRVATGRMAEIQGAAAVSTDQAIRTVFYTPAERAEQFAALPTEVQSLLDAYIAGINAYIALAQAEPAEYLPFEYTQFPLNTMPIETWDRDKAVAVMQFFMRRFGEIGGDELTRLAELQAQGPAWFEANRPINDPAAYTSLQSASGARPALKTSSTIDWTLDPSVAESVRAQRQSVNDDLVAWGVPLKFGSFAAIIRPEASASGAAMLLGAPQMGNPSPTQKAVTSEVEISIAGGFHIAGMTVPGIPGVIIGRTGTQESQRAWTLTTGATDNTDTYAEILGPTGQTYLYNGEQVPFEVIVDQIQVLGGSPVTYPHVRTVHGPVYAQDAASGRAFSWKYTFWERELEMVTAFYNAWKSTSLADWEQVASEVPMSFNLFYADTDGQNVAYWHVGTYPERSVDPRLPASGDGSEEWTGFIDFADQPQAVNFSQPILVNWNNKPEASWDQGDNVQWTSTPPNGYPRYFNGAQFLEDHLTAAQASGDGIRFEELQELTRVVRTNPSYPEYPGTYQQVLEFADGAALRAENVIPPGQSGFVSASGVPSPHFADQWPLYVSSTGSGPILMKDFTFSADVEASITPEALALPAGERSRITFTVRTRNTTGEAQSVRVWTEATLPDGTTYGPLWGPRTFELAAGAVAGPTRVRQSVPAGAPEGLYTIRLYVADAASGEVIDQSAFDFTVGTAPAGKATPEAQPAQSAPEGWDVVEIALGDSPLATTGESTLDAAFPNPTAGALTVPFRVAQDAEVRLSLVDALGREVLVDTQALRAGDHRISLDASGLAAGVYVLRLDIAGSVQSQRVVLTR